jgi:hypothetical protein
LQVLAQRVEQSCARIQLQAVILAVHPEHDGYGRLGARRRRFRTFSRTRRCRGE